MTEQQVRDILTSSQAGTISKKGLAARHGLSLRTVQNVIYGTVHRQIAPELPRIRNGRWRLLSEVTEEETSSLVRMVGARYLEAVGVPSGSRGWAALTACGRVVTVVGNWGRVPELQERWQVVSETHEQLLEREPICETCRFRGRCREAVEQRQQLAA